jgi:hypothetical protein
MKHLYLLPLFLGCLMATAQPTNTAVRQVGLESKNQPLSKSWEANSIQLQSTNCDTFNWPFPPTWNITYYLADNTGGGFVNGTNKYDDKQKANFFDLGATPNAFLNKAIVSFGIPNSLDLTKTVALRVYDVGTDGKPNADLGSASITMQTLKDLRDAGFAFGIFSFPTAINIPSNKKFFISADMSSLQWGTGDSLVLRSNTISQATTNTAWEQWSDNSWNTFPSAWGVNLNFHIYPLTGLTSSCAVVTPIRLVAFSARTTKAGNQLLWQTQSESGNAGFEVQRSRDGKAFTAIGFELSKAANNNSNDKLSYSFNDDRPLPGVNYYRLRQMDVDGKYTFSSIVSVRTTGSTTGSISGYYPNPARNVLNISLNKDLRMGATLQVTDLSGREVLQQKAMATGGVLSLNTAPLKPGIYTVKITEADGTISIIKIAKE